MIRPRSVCACLVAIVLVFVPWRSARAHGVPSIMDVAVAPFVLVLPSAGVEYAPNARTPARAVFAFPFQFGIAAGGRLRLVPAFEAALLENPNADLFRARLGVRYAFRCNGTPGPLSCGDKPEKVDVTAFVEAGGGAAWDSDRATPVAHVGAGILVPFDHEEGWPVLFVALRPSLRPLSTAPFAAGLEVGLSFF